MPRTTQVITISLPPEMAEQVRQLMKEEDRTVSGLIPEASAYTCGRRSGDILNHSEDNAPAGRA